MNMIQKVTHVSLLVSDQQEALTWYTEKLGWVVKSNEPFPDDAQNRWITVAPAGQTEIEVVLQPPHWGPGGDAASRAELVGKSPGFVLVTDDCQGDYETLSAKGVEFPSPPMQMPWGHSAVFVDLYGHAHNLLQPATG